MMTESQTKALKAAADSPIAARRLSYLNGRELAALFAAELATACMSPLGGFWLVITDKGRQAIA